MSNRKMGKSRTPRERRNTGNEKEKEETRYIKHNPCYERPFFKQTSSIPTKRYESKKTQ